MLQNQKESKHISKHKNKCDMLIVLVGELCGKVLSLKLRVFLKSESAQYKSGPGERR